MRVMNDRERVVVVEEQKKKCIFMHNFPNLSEVIIFYFFTRRYPTFSPHLQLNPRAHIMDVKYIYPIHHRWSMLDQNDSTSSK